MTIEELRVLITAKTEGLRDGINKATSRLKGFKKSSDDASSTVNKNVQNMKNQYEQLIKKLDNVNAQAELQQRKLAELKEKYSRFSVLGKDSPKAMKLQEQILRTESRLNNLISTSDKTVGKISELEDKMNNAGNSTEKTSNRFQSLKDRLNQIKDKFKQTGNEAQRSTGKIAGFASSLNKSFTRILKRIFIYNLIYKLIRGLINYLNGALKTNKQFTSSLNTIKTNLRVAFQPIYDFILPAINALMRGLATLTTYIANFTSALFGKTYKQSYDAAKGIETAKKAMDGYGSSAKKTKGQLASFDEINVLNTDNEDNSGKSNDFEMEVPDLTEIHEGPIERLKKSLAELFKPFKDAWNSEGQNTINSIKRAFQNIKEVVGSVGKSFKEVWAGGSGKDVLESLLRLLQLILNIVGDIAAEFKKAWENNDNGTRLIQSVFNALQNVLLLVESIGSSWREVWNNGTGQEMIEHILGILTQISDLVGNIAESFRIAWKANDTGTKILQGIADTLNIILGIFESIGESLNKVWGEVGQDVANTFMKILESSISILKKVAEGFKEIWDRGGQHLFESLIKLGAKIFEIAGFIYTEFVAPFVMWFIEKISPAIGVVLDWIAKLVDGLVWLLDEFLKLLKGIKESKLGEFFVALWDGIKKKTEDTWNAIKTFLVNTIWNPIKNIAKTIWEGIKKHILDPIQQAWTNLKQIWDNIKSYILGKWDEIKNGISSKANALIEAIKSPFNIAKDFVDGIIREAFNWGKNLIGNIVDGISSMIGKVKDATDRVIGAISNKLQFNSPAKEGPGKYADRWMPNMMNMLAEGIEDNVYKVSAAVDVTANTLSGVQKTDNTSSIISAINGALSNSNTSGDIHLTVKIGEDTLTEKVVSNINRQNRISGKTVITI